MISRLGSTARQSQRYLREMPSGGGWRAGIQAQTLPFSRRQLKDQPCRMGRDALDDIAQIHERIDLEVLAGLHQRTQDGGSVRRRFASSEQPVFAAEHDRA